MKYILFSLCCLFTVVLSAQTINWLPAQQVAGSSYSNYQPRVAIDKAGNPLILWGSASGNVYFSRWTGSSFSTPVTLNTVATPAFTATWAGPDLVAHGDTVYAVYKHSPEDTNHMYIVRSFNGGQTFSAPVRIDNIGMSQSRFPNVTTDDNGQPVVGFMKFSMGFMNAKYVVTRSMDYGSTFTPDVMASSFAGEPVCDCCPGTVVSSGTNMVMLYRNNMSNKRTIWAGFSTSSGASFPSGADVDQSNWMVNSCPSSGPDGVIVADTLYTVYMSAASGSGRAYLSKTVVSTQQVKSASMITGSFPGLNSQNYPRIAAAGNNAAIGWIESVNGVNKASLKFTPSLSAGFPAAYDTVATGSISNIDIAMVPGTVFTVWQDNNTGSVMFRRGTYTTTSVERIIRSGLILAPIPADAELNLELADRNLLQNCLLSITDVIGRVVYRRSYAEMQGKVGIPVGTLANGNYTVQLFSPSGTYAQRFTVYHP